MDDSAPAFSALPPRHRATTTRNTPCKPHHPDTLQLGTVRPHAQHTAPMPHQPLPTYVLWSYACLRNVLPARYF